MKAWFGSLISKWFNEDNGGSESQGYNAGSQSDSARRLNELRLRQVSEGWSPDRIAPRQGELIKHWTTGDGKYELPMPTISSDSWSRLEDFLASRRAASKLKENSDSSDHMQAVTR
ncbi:MAG: hypothetical protein C5B53_09600 [Candidatus Melainabacteria bacterium]|nr:MAG: hypothetical protein C5B53_09600 [Candidatus Melainabacteria bacterium]